MVQRVDDSILKWFGHMERMEEEGLPKSCTDLQRRVDGVRMRRSRIRRWTKRVEEIIEQKGYNF